MKKTTKKTPKAWKATADEIAAIIYQERRRAPLDHRDCSDRTADRFVELTAKIYDMDWDTEAEVHRGFTLVWNAYGVWRVQLKRGVVTRLV